jgi:hypothetical protein
MTTENEIWRDIDDTNGRYRVSNLGRVMSLYGRNPRILKPSLDNKGYYRVTPTMNDGKPKTRHIAILVARAFITALKISRTVPNLKTCKIQSTMVLFADWKNTILPS